MSYLRPQKPRVPNYLSQREQRKLLAVVLCIGLLLLAFQEAGKPHTWNWLWKLTGHVVPGEQPRVDTRLPPPKPTQGDDVPTLVAQATRDELADKPTEFKRQLVPGVTLEPLLKVRDDAAFMTVDYDGYFQLLHVLLTTDEKELDRYARRGVTYHQLYNQSAAYRGELIEIHGQVRSVFRDLQARRDNQSGVQKYHQLWLSPNDAPGEVVVVHVLDLPPNLPTTGNLVGDVSLVGFMFKRWAYQSADRELRSTPLLLAQSFTWSRPVVVAAAPRNYAQELIIAVSVAVVVAGCVVMFAFMRSPPGKEPKNPLYEGRKSGRGWETIENLKGQEVAPDVVDALKHLQLPTDELPPPPRHS